MIILHYVDSGSQIWEAKDSFTFSKCKVEPKRKKTQPKMMNGWFYQNAVLGCVGWCWVIIYRAHNFLFLFCWNSWMRMNFRTLGCYVGQANKTIHDDVYFSWLFSVSSFFFSFIFISADITFEMCIVRLISGPEIDCVIAIILMFEVSLTAESSSPINNNYYHGTHFLLSRVACCYFLLFFCCLYGI